jgi:translation elongation factor EF-4
MDVFRQRLEDEYDASIIITAPTVPYKGSCQDLGFFKIMPHTSVQSYTRIEWCLSVTLQISRMSEILLQR